MSTAALDEIPDIPEITFPGGLPGFPGQERFALVRWGGEDSPFCLLRAIEADDVSFVVVPPNLFFPDYEPVITDDAVEQIGIRSADDALLLSIVTVGEPVTASTANLLGPIIVNLRALVGVQAILDPDRYSSAAPLA